MNKTTYETRYLNEVAVLHMLGVPHTSVRMDRSTVHFIYAEEVAQQTIPVVRIGDLWVPLQFVHEMPMNAITRDVNLQVLGGLIRSKMFFVEIISFCDHLHMTKRCVHEALGAGSRPAPASVNTISKRKRRQAQA